MARTSLCWLILEHHLEILQSVKWTKDSKNQPRLVASVLLDPTLFNHLNEKYFKMGIKCFTEVNINLSVLKTRILTRTYNTHTTHGNNEHTTYTHTHTYTYNTHQLSHQHTHIHALITGTTIEHFKKAKPVFRC